MKTGNLFSYLPDDTLVVSHDNLSACHDEYYQQIQARHHSRAHDKSLPIMPPDYLFLANNEFHQVLKASSQSCYQHKPRYGKNWCHGEFTAADFTD